MGVEQGLRTSPASNSSTRKVLGWTVGRKGKAKKGIIEREREKIED
jgi:hypothetical protein